MARVDAHFDKCWNDAVREWESLTNRSGESDQADITECRKMVENGIKMHIDQVESCLNNLSSGILESWRKGKIAPSGLLPMDSPCSGHNLIPVLDPSVVM